MKSSKDAPEITVTVSGAVGIGKSAIALAILDALRALGVQCTWGDEDEERNLGAGAEDIAALSIKPVVRLVELHRNEVLNPERIAAHLAGVDKLLAKFGCRGITSDVMVLVKKLQSPEKTP